MKHYVHIYLPENRGFPESYELTPNEWTWFYGLCVLELVGWNWAITCDNQCGRKDLQVTPYN